MKGKDRIVGLVVARMGSSRLPGKVLADLDGRTVLEWVIGRAQRAKRIDEIVVATSTAESDRAIVRACQNLNLRCFCGSEHDVLGRFVAAMEYSGANWVMRINADNPLIDPAYLDRLVVEALKGQCDYISYRIGNGKPVVLTPVGLFAEMISRSCLLRAQELITSPFEREHVTLGIYKRPSKFRVEFLDLPALFDQPYLRFTLDTPNDLRTIEQIVGLLGRMCDVDAEVLVRLVEAREDLQEAMSCENELNPKTAGQ